MREAPVVPLLKPFEPEMPAARGEDAPELPETGRELVVMVYRRMRLLAGNHPDLEDMAQMALEQILRAQFEGRSKFSTFVYAICYRTWMKHLRFSYRFFRRFEPWTPGLDLLDEATPYTEIVAVERKKKVLETLERLSPKRRAVILLHDFAGLDIEEIPEIVDASLPAVRSRLRDARKQLAQLFSMDPYFNGIVSEEER